MPRNPVVRFDEGRVGRLKRSPSPTLPREISTPRAVYRPSERFATVGWSLFSRASVGYRRRWCSSGTIPNNPTRCVCAPWWWFSGLAPGLAGATGASANPCLC